MMNLDLEPTSIHSVATRWHVNSAAERSEQSAATLAELCPDAAEVVRRLITEWSGYLVTPLIELPILAARLNVRRIRAKHEGWRHPLGNFKALGGAFAVIDHARRTAEARYGVPVSFAELIDGGYRDIVEALHFTCATDGSHGYSVAWGAELIGANCTIYLPEAVSAGREARIAARGSCTERVKGTWDDAVVVAAAAAERFGRIMISDMAFPDYVDTPRFIMQAYTVISREIIDTVGDAPPSHVLLQAGCGSLAAAVAGDMALRYGARRPAFISVEPLRADCVLQSAIAGQSTTVGGNHESIMGGLACGQVSHIALPIILELFDAYLAIDDRFAIEAMQVLAREPGAGAIVAGEAGAAGVAALLAVLEGELAGDLSLGPDSDIVVVISEGAADTALYQSLTGFDPALVEPALYAARSDDSHA